MATLDLVRRIGGANHGLAIVSVARPDGTVHSSLVNAGVLDHPVTGEPVVGLVAAGQARKLTLLRQAGRATLAFNNNWEWVAVEGPIDIAGPDDTDLVAAADIPELLRAVFRAAGGTHDDWDEYDRVMAAEGRTAVLVQPARVTSNAGS
jgi:hypothetical protein